VLVASKRLSLLLLLPLLLLPLLQCLLQHLPTAPAVAADTPLPPPPRLTQTLSLLSRLTKSAPSRAMSGIVITPNSLQAAHVGAGQSTDASKLRLWPARCCRRSSFTVAAALVYVACRIAG
jgi:hypothetical protein